MKANLSFFDLQEMEEQAARIAVPSDLPDAVRIPADDPRREACLSWPWDYTWHMPVHECAPLLEARRQHRIDNPDDVRVTPVVYYWPAYMPDTPRQGKPKAWCHYTGAHSNTLTCPYCGANLAEGEGEVIMERRFERRPYSAPFERHWGEEAQP